MSSKTSSSLALAALLALAAPVGARTIDSWEVLPNGQRCTMVSTFEDDVSIGLIWSPRNGELGFLATVPHPNAVRGNATTPIMLTFDGDARLTEWEDQHAAVVAGKDSDALVATWGPAHSDDLAKAFGAARHVSLRVAGETVGTYDLSGGPAAYRELTQCGRQLAAK